LAIRNLFEERLAARMDARRQSASAQVFIVGPTVVPGTGRRFLVSGSRVELAGSKPQLVARSETPRAMPAPRLTAGDLLRAISERQGLVAASSRAFGSSSRSIIRRARK